MKKKEILIVLLRDLYEQLTLRPVKYVNGKERI